MILGFFQSRSLRTKVTLFTLAIFVVSIWSLIFFTHRTLRQNLRHLLGQQQASTVAFIAAEIDSQLRDRLAILEGVAGNIPPALLRDPAAAQAFLAQRLTLLSMFNGGALLVNQAGTAVAAVPLSASRTALSYTDGDVVTTVLQAGKALIGRPIVSQKLSTPLFDMAAPIRDPTGTVIGAVVGVTDLSKPNFLDHLAGSRYGQSGYYLLEEPQGRLIITGTDKRRAMQTLPAPGGNALIDRHVQGSDETGVTLNPLGVEVMATAARVPAAGWFLLAALPTEEAFAPIRQLLRPLSLAAITLTLLAGGLTWWMLQRQLSPLQVTAERIGAWAAELPGSLQPLAITRQDEIGRLIGAFNRLLATLRRREDALQESEGRFRTLVEWSPEAIGVHRDGKLLYVNPAAITLFGAQSADDLVGTPILDRVHPDFHRLVLERAKTVAERGGVVPVINEKFITLDGTVIDAEVQSAAIVYDGAPAVYVALSDITARQRALAALQASETVLRDSQITAGLGSYVLDFPTGQWRPSAALETVLGIDSTYECSVAGWVALVHPDERSAMVDYFRDHVVGRRQPFNREYRVIRPSDQAERWVCGLGRLEFDALGHPLKMHGTIQDITVRKHAKTALHASLLEKESLLKEVHHRVKNNLQVITSLLRLESRRSVEPATKAVLGDMQGRIRSMALLHESLYRSGTFAAVDLGAYLKQLATQLFRSLLASPGAVQLTLDLASVSVEMDQALPCGLLVNELVSNALKHGFPAGRTGEVRVVLQPVAGGPSWRLAVSDTGLGLPADFAARRGQTLGLQLVSDLAGQLRGTLEVDSTPDAGAVFTVTFALGETQPPVAPA